MAILSRANRTNGLLHDAAGIERIAVVTISPRLDVVA
jgi:hypothetical protein